MFLPSKKSADAASSAELFVPMESAIEPNLTSCRRSFKNVVSNQLRFSEGKCRGSISWPPKGVRNLGIYTIRRILSPVNKKFQRILN